MQLFQACQAGNASSRSSSSGSKCSNSSRRSASTHEDERSQDSGGSRSRTMSDVVEDLKRGTLIRPQNDETKEQAEEKLFADLDEHDLLNDQLTSTYASFVREGRSHGWHEIPPAGAPRRVVFMFLVVDRLHNDAWWRTYFEQADMDGYENAYSIVYHRGCSYGKDRDDVCNDVLAERGLAVRPATKTGWARSGLVRATLLLMRFGLENPDNTWFVLLSDACMPLYSFRDLYDQVKLENFSRFNDFGVTFDVTLRRNIWQSGTCEGHRRSRKADQWAMFTRADAEWFVRENHLLQLKPRAVYVDEPYFINMMDQHDRPYKHAPTTYTEWYHMSDLPGLHSENKVDVLQKMVSSPHTFQAVDMDTIQKARNSGCWFMRKVCLDAQFPALHELELERYC
eukprot:TRINITY_DN7821_c0_g5_i1.p1 TRINITY_DN7821_c0_g5~~TRINITY_DN7821_c0_g5_i1.p1  ORF type:complete len:397 (-),score=41.21 TRINITY_DN7821_c0_g5_i1:180-1370(-)